MSLPKIENLENIIDLGEEKIVKFETSRLTAIGENYGSQMLVLKITTNTKTFEVVAKTPPPGEVIRRMFNVPVTFKNEFNFYQKIIPELEKLLKEHHCENYLDCFPKFLGGRLSLNPQQTEVDDDAILILENLKIQGYQMLDRTKGFDYETTKVILRSLAKYHAAPIALKFQKPQVFQTKIRSLFQPYRIFDIGKTGMDSIAEKFGKLTSQIDSCSNYAQKVEDFMKSTTQKEKNSEHFIREPFATIIHCDIWVNNFMVKFQDGKPKNCKIVDFQLYEYGSLARDLIFFMFTSVQIEVVDKFYDDLVQFYHKSLLEDLQKFGCDTQQFSFDELTREINLSMKEHEIHHILVMLQPIYATKDTLKELDQFKDKDFTHQSYVSPEMKVKAEFLIHQFIKRKWL